MKKKQKDIILPIDERRRKQIFLLFEEALQNAPVPFPKAEMTHLLKEINALRRRTYKVKVRQIRQLLTRPKRIPTIQRPWTVVYGRFRKGKKH